MSHINELLYVSPKQKDKVRKSFGKTEKDVEDDVNMLLDWLIKQRHLPKDHDKDRLERFLVRNKFRMQQSKTKQDNYYSYRGLYPEFFQHIDPSSTAMSNVRKCGQFVMMPTLLPNLNRLCITRFMEDKDEFFNLTDFVGYILLFMDLQLSHDYELANHFVIDCTNLSMRYIMKFDPFALRKAHVLHQSAFSGRVSHIDFVNVLPVFDVLLGLLKKVLDAKLFSKIRVHNNLESLNEVLPKRHLPKEFGGAQQSMDEIHEKWSQELIVQSQFLKENAKRVSNEKLRVGKSVRNELFGLEGTFRKINLD